MNADHRRPLTRAFRTGQRRLRRGMAVLAAAVSLSLSLPVLPAAAAGVDAWTSPSAGNGNTLDNPGEATITAASAARMTRAWSTYDSNFDPQAPAVVGGVVYYLHRYTNVATDTHALVAASARTGKTLWRVPLTRPGYLWFDDGVTVAGHLVLIPFETLPEAAGLMAVDTRTHKIVWTTVAPPNSGFATDHRVHADGTRAYMHFTDSTMAAFRLTDGKLQWTVALPRLNGIGIALGAGILYVGSQDWDGITAYAAATGRQLWTAPGLGTPVVAGGRVFSVRYSTLIAVNAAGCGRPTCPALWTRTFPTAVDTRLMLGAADAGTLFLTYQKAVPPDQYGVRVAGVMVRLSAATGAQQWTATLGAYLGPPVRGGNMVWSVTEHAVAGGYVVDQIAGFAASGSATKPRVVLPSAQNGSPQVLAVGSGTLFDQTLISGLVAYRVPGT